MADEEQQEVEIKSGMTVCDSVTGEIGLVIDVHGWVVRVQIWTLGFPEIVEWDRGACVVVDRS